MPEFDIPPKENRSRQALFAVIVLVIVSILVALFARVIVGLVIFLLGTIAGIGVQVTGNNPFSKD